MAHKRTTQPVPDEPEQSHGDEQEKETVYTDEYKRAIEEAFRTNEDRVQAALQLAEAHYMELERTKSQLRAIIDASQEAMLFLSPDGRPLKVNMRFTDFFGLDDTTVLSQSADQLTELLKGLFVDAVLPDQSLAWGTTDQKRIFREKQLQVGPERREYDFASLPVMNVNQTYIGRLYVWHDATHEREVDRMKSGFVSMVSHELRTPLTSIKGYVDLVLTDETVGELNELQREFLEIVQNNARRLERLVNDLLDLSRMESGKIELHRKPLDITLLIRELLPSFQPGWDARRQTFTLHLPEIAPKVLGDADRVTQILSNLLSNAHKYTPDEGHIDLSVKIAEPVARVEVTDSGIGMSKEEQSLLFTPFYRANNPTTEAVGGTGLGLLITRSLVEMQGGEMQVSSKPGHGSTFGFTLPLAQVLEPTTFPQETLLGKRILVVDDEKDTRHLLRSYLQGAGYEVMTAPDALTAFQLARTARPDLITLDMLLPNNHGLPPILELLKSDAITASIPVILLTVVNNDGQRRLLGATDYLDKPIEASDLLQRITTVFADQTRHLILLVTPESESHEPLASALREAGHRVTFVPDGRKLLALVKRTHPGLIILDATVPPMGGLALLQALRADPATNKLPVIMTGIQPGELGMHWHTLTPIGYVDIWGNPGHVKAIVQVITQRLQTGTSASFQMLPG
jgi:signal transduction histidine kinase/CheY-like chemotaxis protein